jgi:hypothetical protein
MHDTHAPVMCYGCEAWAIHTHTHKTREISRQTEQTLKDDGNLSQSSKQSKPLLIRINCGVIRISEAKSSPKRQKKKKELGTKTNGKFSDINSSDENK